MGLTSFRLRDRREAENRSAPRPAPAPTPQQIEESRRKECRDLRTKNAALQQEISTLNARVAELEQQVDALTVPALSPQDINPTSKQRRRG